MMKRALLLFLVVALAGSGCLKNETLGPSDTATDTNLEAVEVFFGNLSPGGSNIHGFSALQNTTVRITFASLVLNGTSTTLSTPLKITLGTLNGDASACNGSTVVTVAPGLTTQITQALTAGGYCVALEDVSGLPGDVTFAARILQTNDFEPQGQAGTEPFSSNIYPGTSINRTVAVSATGSINVTLSNVSPASSIGVGLGVTSNGRDCYLHKAVISTPGQSATITADGDPDVYCVRVFDPGTLTGRTQFQISISHP